MTSMKPGTIIKGSLWPEPIEIKLIEQRGIISKMSVKNRFHMVMF
jgi:hypothetical protein